MGVAVLVVAIIAIAEPKSHPRKDVAASGSGASSSTAPSSSASRSSGSTSRSSSPTGSGPSLSLGSSTPPSAGGRLPLIVLNNTQTANLASGAAERFRGGGWTVTETGNLVNDILSTCAYYDPSVDGSKAAAERLMRQFPAIQRVAERFPELPSGPIVVVLTGDYTPG